MFIKNFYAICLVILGSFFIACASQKLSHYWPIYKSDATSSSYSAADQINKTNVQHLQMIWKFDPEDAPAGVRYGKYECNPIVVNGRIYATSARRRVYAIDGVTGAKIWGFDPFDGARGGGMCRGVTYWTDGIEERILFTADNYLFALNATTGQSIGSFGQNGKVDLNQNLGVDPDSIWVKPTTPGIIYRDKIILGSEVSESYDAAPGHLRAYNVKTGAMEWIFHTIPQPGEYGYESWPPEAYKYTGGANNWAGMCLDTARGIVYAPLGSPTYDFYGANRKGENLFGNSLVALDAASGKLLWHFQTVHHDLWDYDLPAPPNLVTVEKDGKMIDAVSITTKTGFIFLFDRVTGEPIYPIEERPVPAATIDGEETWPTQPIPTHPAPFSRQRLTEDNLTDVSAEAHDTVLKRFREMRSDGLFTPADIRGTIMLPGTRGGAEWGGSAYDPATSILYVNGNESPEILTLHQAGVENKGRSFTFNQYGQRYYSAFCSSCHGKDLAGDISSPSLQNLGSRLAKSETLEKIRKGSGRMPGFTLMTENEEKAIIAFLYDEGKDEMVPRNSNPKTNKGYQNVTAYSYFLDPDGFPAISQPWGTLNAYNCVTGAYEWQVPLGNYPEKQKDGGPSTGAENWGGPIVTAGGLVFIAATKDEKFRAFDKTNGNLLWETSLPGGGYATPTTYMHKGRQYVIIAVTGTNENPTGNIVAFALPKKIKS
ncbi:MAG: PQQ-binding-like beta-propeller repeat protein [Saprospiraceae bacterium]|nr:PQQ-binding-like beta-propeller repeat protein [Saprospiraceae bacterium]